MAWKLVSTRRHSADSDKKKKNRRKTRRFLITLLLILAVVLALEGFVYFYLFGSMERDREFAALSDESLGRIDMDEAVSIDPARTEQTLDEDTGELLFSVIPEDILEKYYRGSGRLLKRRLLDGADDIQLFVLYGVDDHDGSLAQATTDAIMLAAVDKVHHKLKFISLSRDSYVYYPEKNAMTKLNYAYHYGGVPGAVRTLNTNYFLNISDYVVVRMTEMANLVDMVGGVTVELTQEEIDNCSALHGLPPGKNTLSGDQATAYARIRNIDSDTYRSNRQFNVLQSFISTAKHTSPAKYPAIVRDGLGMVTTSFSAADLLSMSSILLDSELEISHCYMPDSEKAWGGEIDGHWYYVYDTLETSDEICRLVYEDLYESEFIAAE